MRNMKRLLFVVLMTVCSVSWAEWELCSIIGVGEEKISRYCDKSTIRKNGAISRIWNIINYSKLQTDSSGDRWMSTKVLMAFNCREETTAVISFTGYSELMGNGKVVFTGTRQEREWQWEPIVPESSGESIWKIVCGK